MFYLTFKKDIYTFRFPLEMHMVHINSKYVNDDGSLDSAFASNSDGAAVLGFMLSVPSGTQEVHIIFDAVYNKNIYFQNFILSILFIFYQKFMHFIYFSGLCAVGGKYCNRIYLK